VVVGPDLGVDECLELGRQRLDEPEVVGVGGEVLRLAGIALTVVEHDVVVPHEVLDPARSVRLER
jgi:hypothetical protein